MQLLNLPVHTIAAFSLLIGVILLPGRLCMAETITYAWPATMMDDPRGHYPIALLHLALQKSNSSFQPIPSKRDHAQWRSLRQVQFGNGLDVIWTFTTSTREQELMPIRIPIDRGLLGWRLFLIKDEAQALFSTIDVQQLMLLRSGQGHDWPDLPVLEKNGFNVVPSSSYSGLFAMLKRGRILYFPRSVTEIWSEQHLYQQEGIRIEKRWALYYPAPLYFFVSRNRPELAADIESGLRTAINDGSMKQLFLQHFSNAIAQASLHQRQIVELKNHDLPAATPLTDTSLWFDPQQGY
ncbi:hypothetical protein [Arsukibacterium sp.]|uniref:hypothetical protein n=1 Tax=Arsukibacterium sp. TaxID=1977258 RepID=UPI00299F248C|nr:hypothetical protein [Arsukibacterium sp.]MDX1677738.1 hypothetical protein [Arsukibacterium sp.]